jgi:general secretion pathway protein K
MRRPERGFALLAALWLMLGVTGLVLAISLNARGAVTTARNRIVLLGNAWSAEDCLERTRAAITRVLRTEREGVEGEGRPWLRLGQIVAESPLTLDCVDRLNLSATGTAVDVNAVGEEELRRLLDRFAVARSHRDSLIDALLDWRDRDDAPRPLGAERDWYERHGRSPPRNGPIASLVELDRIRGFEAIADESSPTHAIRRALTVETGRIVVDLAPIEVLAMLPGFTDETLARITERRLRSAPPLTDVLELGAELSPASVDSLHAAYQDLRRLTAADPEAWIITARGGGSAGATPRVPVATIELKVVRSGPRVAIVRRRSWP